MEIIKRGKQNPIIAIGPDEVLAWVRAQVDSAGYADRQINAVQISVVSPFRGETNVHNEVPKLVCMVSNIPNSRTQEN